MVSQTLTQFVNLIAEGSQFQAMRSFRVKGGRGYIFSFDFFPWASGTPSIGKEALFLGSERGQLAWRFSEKSKIFEQIRLELHDCPPLIFAKSHLKNKKITRSTSVSESEFLWEFAGGAKLKGKISAHQNPPVLEFEIHVPGRPKDFRSQIELANWGQAASKVETNSQKHLENQKTKKLKNLEANVLADVNRYNLRSKFWADLAISLETNGEFQNFLSHEFFIEAQAKKEIPVLKNEKTWEFLDAVFKQKKKFEKKYLGSKTRLESLKTQSPVLKTKRQSQPKEEISADSEILKPKKKPGLWIQSPWDPGLWARVGRNSKENDELYRQARDRDLWFHIRTSPGGHVWIPRGQPGFGAKSAAHENLLRFGAQLALINSKIRATVGGPGHEVDFTERRNLKKTKGLGGGKILVLKSDTRNQKLESEFESLIKGA